MMMICTMPRTTLAGSGTSSIVTQDSTVSRVYVWVNRAGLTLCELLPIYPK